jgi:predicted RNase H-like HicB family nuclease
MPKSATDSHRSSQMQIVIEREGRFWLAHAPSVQGCHTYGRSIEQTLTRTREALGLFMSDVDGLKLEPVMKLPRAWSQHAESVRGSQERHALARVDAATAMRAAVRELSADGLSRRDVARLLTITPQRVQQVLHER